MNMEIKQAFMDRWRTYFNDLELPITFFYSETPAGAELPEKARGHRCFICDLTAVRQGRSLAFGLETIPCAGGKRYTGFTQQLRPGFEYFLSCGIPGKMEGERYKKSPEIVKTIMERAPDMKAPASHIVFKRWDKLEAADNPKVVIFFATPDMLSGLFTLVNYDEVDLQGVITPFAAGCGTIILYPYLENISDHPRAVLGMFDVSSRPCVGQNELTLAIPMKKFLHMVADMDESFLITESWKQVQQRLHP